MKMFVTQEFMVSDQMIFRQNTPVLVADSTNMIQFSFSFNEAWEDINKTAIIVTGGVTYTCPILDDGTISEDVMPILRSGECLVSVFGGSLNTANACRLTIGTSGYSAVVPPEPPDPGQIYVKSVSNQIYFIRENLGDFEYSLDGQTWKVVSGGGGSSGKSPYIGENGNWYQFDDTARAWVDTGVRAEGIPGPVGPQGIQGEPGAPGAKGDPGVGVPTGGTAGQVLAKQSENDYDTKWVDQSGGGGTTNHASLENLDYESSGHKGFATAAQGALAEAAVQDPNYVHTDNNFSSIDKNNLSTALSNSAVAVEGANIAKATAIAASNKADTVAADLQEEVIARQEADDTLNSLIATKAPLSFASPLYLTRTGTTTATLNETKPIVAPANYMQFNIPNAFSAIGSPLFTITRTVGNNIILTNTNGSDIDLFGAFNGDVRCEFAYRAVYSTDGGATWIPMSTRQPFGVNDYSGSGSYANVADIPKRTLIFDELTNPLNLVVGNLVRYEGYARFLNNSVTCRIFCGVNLGGADHFSMAQINLQSVALNATNYANESITEPKLSLALQNKINDTIPKSIQVLKTIETSPVAIDELGRLWSRPDLVGGLGASYELIFTSSDFSGGKLTIPASIHNLGTKPFVSMFEKYDSAVGMWYNVTYQTETNAAGDISFVGDPIDGRLILTNVSVSSNAKLTLNVGVGGDFLMISEAYDYAEKFVYNQLVLNLISDINETKDGFTLKRGRNIIVGNGYKLNITTIGSHFWVGVNSTLTINGVLTIIGKATGSDNILTATSSGLLYINGATIVVDNQGGSGSCIAALNTGSLYIDGGSNTTLKNSGIGLKASQVSQARTANTPTFTNVTTQYSPNKNTVGNNNSYIMAP